MLKKTILLVVLISFLSLSASVLPQTSWVSKIDARLFEAQEQQPQEVIILLKAQADLSGAAQLPSKVEKNRFVYEQLTQIAQHTQAPLMNWLNNHAIPHRAYWVVNMIWAHTEMKTIRQLAQRKDIAFIYANVHIPFRLPAPEPPPYPPHGQPQTIETVEWNIQKVNAPLVWAAGFTGQGIVIGGQDTGYAWEHPALKNQYRGWNGVAADHNYNWHDAIHGNDTHTPPGNPCGFNSPAPCDDHGHGTHTMGIMVGDDGAGNQIGMAPGAKWIGCRNMEEGWGTPVTYAECYQWFLAPTDLSGANPRPDLAPDIINNSWSCPPSEGCTQPLILQMVVENVRAAGILSVHAAGNDGPACGTIDTPAAIYDASFTVGNTTIDDLIASSSSRGPVTVDGSNRLKPDVSAPGTWIRSSIPSGYGMMSGTSMAAPHVAGLAALLLSAQPALRGDVEQIEAVITQNALPKVTSQDCGGVSGSNIPNNTYGWGRIDAWESFQHLPHRFTLEKQPSSFFIHPGELLTYTLQLTHYHPFSATHHTILSDTLPTATNMITATMPFNLQGGTIFWEVGEMTPEAQFLARLVVHIPLGFDSPWLTNLFYAAQSDEVDLLFGRPVTVWVNHNFLFFPILGR